MNIFAVAKSPRVSARSLPDKLVVKMPLESAQMLSTSLRCFMSDDVCDTLGIYKVAFKNHPCTIWARTSRSNYDWLVSHFETLCDEYTARYGRTHASRRLLWAFKNCRIFIPKGSMTPFAQAMTDQYKCDNHIKAYRDYVVNEKHYAKWNFTMKPVWWEVA